MGGGGGGYKFKLLKTQLRVHVYVAHYVIFLLLVERWVAYLSKSSKKQILLLATKGARNPNLNVAFTNACAAVIYFGPDSILLKSWVFHHECMECKECYFLTRITRNIWTLDHVKVMHSSCARQSKSSVSTWIRPFCSCCRVVCHSPVLSWCTGSQGNDHCSFVVLESLVSCCVLFCPL